MTMENLSPRLGDRDRSPLNPKLEMLQQMAGYFIYTLEGSAFSQLTTSPTDDQAMAIAKYLQESVGDSEAFPSDLSKLADAIKTRLSSPDWYADLDEDDAEIWDKFVFSLRDDVGKAVGIGFECTDYESVYWDCAEECVAQGADMFKEPEFGSSGFRFHGELAHEYGYHRIYSIFDPETVKRLAEQLSTVQAHFANLPDDGEGCVREQFFDGLLKPIGDAVARGRYIFIQTDT
ncbi:hypothetical protein [Rosistilla carotiformis]|nr:hypothetical protein [Rosistilla carotiformis]